MFKLLYDIVEFIGYIFFNPELIANETIKESIIDGVSCTVGFIVFIYVLEFISQGVFQWTLFWKIIAFIIFLRHLILITIITSNKYSNKK